MNTVLAIVLGVVAAVVLVAIFMAVIALFAPKNTLDRF